jgi:hypothetical protein
MGKSLSKSAKKCHFEDIAPDQTPPKFKKANRLRIPPGLFSVKPGSRESEAPHGAKYQMIEEDG